MAFFHEKELKEYVRELKTDWKRAEKEYKKTGASTASAKWLRRLDRDMQRLENIADFSHFDLYEALEVLRRRP